jgi:hypothetical protein
MNGTRWAIRPATRPTSRDSLEGIRWTGAAELSEDESHLQEQTMIGGSTILKGDYEA